MNRPIERLKLREIVGQDRPITYGILKPGPDIEGGIPYVRVVDMQNGTVRVNEVRRTTAAIARQYTRSSLKAGDILLSIRGHVGRVAIVPAELEGANITQDTARLAVNGACNAQYLYWFLQTADVQHWMRKHMKGVAVKGINLGDVKELEVPIVEPAKQRRIATILDKADALRRKREEGIRLTEALLRSTFLEMFGDPMIGSGTPLMDLAEVVSGVTKGRKLNGRAVTVPYLRVANVQDGFLNLNEIKTIEALPDEVTALSLQDGDIVMTEGGDYDKLGRGAIWNASIPNCIHQNHVFRVRVDRQSLLPSYFAAFLRTSQAKRYFLRCAKKTTNLASINMTQLRGLPVPVPSIALQRKFEDAAIAINGLADCRKQALSEAGSLFGSLVQRAFRGQL